jgi:2,3-bisphosphoglycerate-independent phosphoglycerate mutase
VTVGCALLLFIDGVGIGEADPAINPFVTARIPTLERLLGGVRPVLGAQTPPDADAVLIPIDATLGFPGLPQSGTGHTALLTGENAVALFGRHFGPWVPTALRPLVAERSLLARGVAAGKRVAFANAYPEEVLQAAASGRTRGPHALPLRTGPFLAARAAGLLTRHTPELQRGQAVASELTNEAWRAQLGRRELPRIDAHQAGVNLARIAAAHDLTLFAHYGTDHIGHDGSLAAAVAAVERIDAFLGGVLQGVSPAVTVVVASDHGNLEDVRSGHTRNPALGLVTGAHRDTLAGRIRSLMDVTPALLELVGAG